MADLDTRTRYCVDGIVPDEVALPSGEGEVADLLKPAGSQDRVVVPWGAGTKQDLGRPLERCGLVVSLERLNRVVDYVPADMTVTVEAGMRLSDLQAIVAQNGQMVPLDPPRAGQATLGGIAAAAAFGPRRAAYGGVRDLLLGCRVALADGRVIKAGGKVVKNVAGYDLTKLMIGSLGTLGIITEVSLRLRPAPADRRTLLFGFADSGPALEAAERIMQSELLPVAVTVLSPAAARRLGAPGEWALALALEESLENNVYQAGRLAELLGAPAETGPEFWDGVADYGDRFGALFRLRYSAVIGELAHLLRDAGALESVVYADSGTVLMYGFAPEAARSGAVLESGPVEMRRRYEVWGPPRPEWDLTRLIKRTFDPGGVLNRGRYVGGI
ncbi:MAG: FAD-binding oxidoreductase [Bryobacterales bacterium]|nr:FAD-binding oxidoreductase [Bryobacterales bacterium]